MVGSLRNWELRLMKYHFRVSENAKKGRLEVQEDSYEASAPFRQGIYDKNYKPIYFGIALHAFQDSFSHDGYYNDHSGAPMGGHECDIPWVYPAKTKRMAERTYQQLSGLYEKMTSTKDNPRGTTPNKTFSQIWEKIRSLLVE